MDFKIKEKRWDKTLEEPIISKWKQEKAYSFKKDEEKLVFSIDTPPPYLNTPIHVGHATTYVLMDMFARFRRMKGFNVLFPLGLDNNGLPIEMAAEKKFKKKFFEVSREEFLQMCKEVLKEAGMKSVESFYRLGIGFNSWNLGNKLGDIYETDSPEYRALTQSTFIDLWEKGLVYEDERINNYCPGCRTTIADSEIEYTDLPSKFNDIKFKVKETGEEIVIGTTRPELIPSCGMIIFNPDDERYKELEGKTAVTPLFEKAIPIQAHPFADKEKGTGLMMMCSAGDTTDIRFYREMGLEPVISIGQDGRMNENAGFLEGMLVKEAREKTIEELKSKNLLVKQEDIMHRTPICERSKDPIEFISMPEFYVKQLNFKKDMMDIAYSLEFYDEKSRQLLVDWISSVSIDWPISRRRYYATEIPLWYCEKCSEVYLPPKGKYYQPWKERPPIRGCPKCGHEKFKGETRVFDTWFDSSNTPLYILGYERFQDFFDENKPCYLRPQGKEIVRTWLYYTLLKSYLLNGESIFQDVWINYHIVDEHGKKMSKSVGNVIDPKEILVKYGAEPFRMWAAVEGNLDSTDFRCSYERIEGAGKTLTKLWNVSRFISMFPKAEKPNELIELDKWIISELKNIADLANKKFKDYDFHNPIILLKNFLWEAFASHYMEMVKGRAYNNEGKFSKEEQDSALYTLHYCLDVMLKMFAPVIPMITYKLYNDLYGKDVHFEEFPVIEENYKEEVGFETKDLIALNSEVWKAKKDAGRSLRDEVEKLAVPAIFKGIEKDLKQAHNVSNLEFKNTEK